MPVTAWVTDSVSPPIHSTYTELSNWPARTSTTS